MTPTITAKMSRYIVATTLRRRRVKKSFPDDPAPEVDADGLTHGRGGGILTDSKRLRIPPDSALVPGGNGGLK